MRSLPNIITFLRIIASVVVPILIMVDTPLFRLIAAVVFVLAALTDWLDGYLARQLNVISALGRTLDPIADKLLVATTLLALASVDNWGWEMFIPAVFILITGTLSSGFREFTSGTKSVIRAKFLAKTKTAFQLIGLGLAIIAPTTPAFFDWHIENISIAFIWVAALLSLVTSWNYYKQAFPDEAPR